MKSITELSLRYIKMNKRQSLFIIICVMLSVALTMFTLTAYTTVRENIRKNIAQNGNWEVCVTGMTQEEAATLSHHAAMEDSVQLSCLLGSEIYGMTMGGRLFTAHEPDESYSCVQLTDSDFTLNIIRTEEYAHPLLRKFIEEGTPPRDNSEIAVPRSFGKKVGDTISLSINTFTTELLKHDYDTYISSIEKSDSIALTYTVCGILSDTFSDKAVLIANNDTHIENALSKAVRKYAIFASLKDKNANYREAILDICSENGISLTSVSEEAFLFTYRGTDEILLEEPYTAHINFPLMEAAAYGSEARSHLIEQLAVMYIAVLFILGASRMIIDCEFELTYQKKQHQMGLLMAMGADDRSLIRLTVTEGLILGVAAVPLGLALGAGLAAIVCGYLNAKGNLGIVIKNDIDVCVKPICLLLSGITGIGWVFFSAYGTAVRIKKLTPNEALKGMKKNGKLPFPKRKKFTSNPKKFLYNLARNTVSCEKRRYVSTLIAIVISTNLFIGLTYATGIIAEPLLNNSYDEENVREFAVQTLADSRSIGDIRRSFAESGLFIPLEEFTFEDKDEHPVDIGEYHDMELCLNDMEDETKVYPYIRVISLSPQQYGKMFPESKRSYEDMSEGLILMPADGDISLYEGCHIDSTVSSTDNIYLMNNNYIGMNKSGELTFIDNGEAALNRQTRTRIGKYMLSSLSSRRIFYVTEAVFDRLARSYSGDTDIRDIKDLVYIGLSMTEGTDYFEAVSYLEEKGYSYEDYRLDYYYSQAILDIIRTVCAAIIAVSVLIAVSNIVNITVSGINENGRGYALLRAAGMDDSQLEKTALYQTLIPAVDSAVISLGTVLVTVFIIGVAKYKFFFHPRSGGTTLFDPLSAVILYIIAVIGAAAISLICCIKPLRDSEDICIAEAVKDDI